MYLRPSRKLLQLGLWTRAGPGRFFPLPASKLGHLSRIDDRARIASLQRTRLVGQRHLIAANWTYSLGSIRYTRFLFTLHLLTQPQTVDRVCRNRR